MLVGRLARISAGVGQLQVGEQQISVGQHPDAGRGVVRSQIQVSIVLQPFNEGIRSALWLTNNRRLSVYCAALTRVQRVLDEIWPKSCSKNRMKMNIKYQTSTNIQSDKRIVEEDKQDPQIDAMCLIFPHMFLVRLLAVKTDLDNSTDRASGKCHAR